MSIADVSSRSLEQLVSLKGRRAVVTGGAKGLGRAIAHRLAEAGASVLIGDIDVETATSAAKQLASTLDRRVLATRLDVTRTESIVAAADMAVRELGGLDIWVNNAGIYPLTPVLSMPDEEWDRVIAINLRGTFIGCREAARRMSDAKTGGVIINIASTAGFKAAGPGVTHYVASKHGVRGITRQLSLEFAPQNIRVLAIAPTTIMTEGVADATKKVDAIGFDLQQTMNSMLGRTGVPDDVARVALFCASDLSLFMTGSTLAVDAGDLVR
ncbi:MAG: SDR family NAD(P)-dependent oxidoreductase [Steroidobacteraceae bacterium]